MDILYYIWDIICTAWWIFLLSGLIAIPLLSYIFQSDREYEDLYDYYDCEQFNEFKDKEDE